MIFKTNSPTSPMPSSPSVTTASADGLTGLLRKLHSIEIGPKRPGDSTKIRPGVLSDVFRLILMMLDNGLSLPKTLATLEADRSSKKYRHLLQRIRMTIESGGSLSEAMAHYPRTFTPMQIQQIRIGERSGTLEKAIAHVCEQLERQVALRKRIIKKVSYPMLITVAGFGLMVFMCVVVVPEFETVYSSSGVELPTVTRVVTATSRNVIRWGWLMIPAIGALISGWSMARAHPKMSAAIDVFLLRLPIFGPWFRDVAVLQFAEAASSMVQCGYKPVEAVQVAANCVRNRAIRAAVEDVQRGVLRGERLSTELSRYDHYFSATMCQLVAVGEQSGDFPKAMQGTCAHLRERLETRLDATVGMLEPTLTISLAAMIGGIVLSIYTPMFHMFEVLE